MVLQIEQTTGRFVHGPDFVNFSADFKLNLHTYSQLLPGIIVAVLSLPDPITRSMEQPSRPQNPHTNPRSDLIMCTPTCFLITFFVKSSPHIRHGIFSNKVPGSIVVANVSW